MGTQVPQPVEYEATPASPVGRRGYRWLLGLTLLNTVMLAYLLVGQHGLPYVRQQWAQWKQARAAEQARQQALVRAAQREQQRLAAQQQCLTYAAPADQVVYDEHPVRAAALLAGGGGYETFRSSTSPLGRGNQPPPRWQEPVRAAPPPAFTALAKEWYARAGVVVRLSSGGTQRVTPDGSALLFLHERATPAGDRQLVVVRLASARSFTDGTGRRGVQGNERTFTASKDRVLIAESWSLAAPGTEARLTSSCQLPLLLPDSRRQEVVRFPEPSAEGEIPVPYHGHALRFLAGRPDQADASRFTLSYDVDGRPGVIDGRLGDEGISLTPRTGRKLLINLVETWDLTPDAPPPAVPVQQP